MAIKISKVIKDLNVGRQTIEEFLHKKNIEIDASINARIDDDVYEMLVKEFKPDMDLKSKSDKMATERQKEKAKQNAAKESNEIKTVVPGQKPKILGKIDIDAAGKPKASIKPEPAPEVREEKPAEKKAKAKSAEQAPAEKPQTKPEPQDEPAAPVAEEPARVEAPADVDAAPAPQEVSDSEAAAKENDEDDNVYKPVSQTTGGPQLKVVGKVDLTSINQQTRPRKKSK